jgi:lysyl-tRNA synthetase class 2
MADRKFNDQEIAKRKKLAKMCENGDNPFLIQKFDRTHTTNSFKEEFNKFSKEELHDNKTDVKICGRVMAIRQTFGVILDFYGKLQFYINKKNVDEKVNKTFDECLDIGDIVGLEGTPMKTNTGEITLNVTNITILSKSLKPLPEKYHGLQDEEMRARHRYVDLFMNDESMKTFVTRSMIISEIRRFMDSQDFFEVETPILQPILGGAAARPFVTYHNTLKRNFYLRVAPELPLKKLIVGGFEKVYEIGRVFRNEGMDTTHNPEFTTIEAY